MWLSLRLNAGRTSTRHIGTEATLSSCLDRWRKATAACWIRHGSLGTGFLALHRLLGRCYTRPRPLHRRPSIHYMTLLDPTPWGIWGSGARPSFGRRLLLAYCDSQPFQLWYVDQPKSEHCRLVADGTLATAVEHCCYGVLRRPAGVTVNSQLERAPYELSEQLDCENRSVFMSTMSG